jgi:hypothetical protein
MLAIISRSCLLVLVLRSRQVLPRLRFKKLQVLLRVQIPRIVHFGHEDLGPCKHIDNVGILGKVLRIRAVKRIFSRYLGRKA